MTFPPIQRTVCGTALPVSALKTEKSCGVGEFSDLIPFSDFCKKAGLGIIQLLPINDTGTDSSPYNALSAFALHPLFICLQDIREARPFEDEIELCRNKFAQQHAAERFNYRKVLHAKNTILHKIFNKSEAAIMKEAETGAFAQWIQKNPWIIEYAVFKNIKRQNYHASWKEWKEWSCMRFPSEADIKKVWEDKTLQREHLFYAWVQMQLHEQLLKAVQHCAKNGILIKGDIPILMNEDSVEVWAHPEYFRTDLRAGSPPDADNPSGQNWGFPIYNWPNLRESGYLWWKQRLQHAAQYYHAYRLDHILGFFRIWAIPEGERTGVLGKPLPYAEITTQDLLQAGFSKERIRWMAEPHIPTYSVQAAVQNDYLYAHGLLHKVMDRIGSEELWLFKPEITRESDISSYDLPEHVKEILRQKWRDRMLISAGKDLNGAAIYTAAYLYSTASAWYSLSDHEKKQFSTLMAEKEAQQSLLWKKQAEEILSALCSSVDMQPCAEDLGAIPAVLPEVLNALHIHSLKVFRWERQWVEPGSPFIPLKDYPEYAVAVTSVHDSSALRQWWEEELSETDIPSLFCALNMPEELCRKYSANGKAPYSEGLAFDLLSAFTKGAAHLPIFPIQDWLGLIYDSLKDIPACEERINVPGTVNDSNWTYRMPVAVEKLVKNKKLIAAIKTIVGK